MNISSVGFSFQNNINSKKYVKNSPSFRGQIPCDNSSNIPYEQVDLTYLLINPMTNFYKQLLKDGFSAEQIKKHQIFQLTHINPNVNLGALNNDIDMDAIEQNRDKIKDILFVRESKTLDDYRAMSKLYPKLISKFFTDDVIEHVNRTKEIYDRLSSLSGSKETTTDEIAKDSVLDIIHYANRHNKVLIEALLDEKDFNNTCISAALIGVDDENSANSAIKALQIAHNKGFDKEFSFPLAVMLSDVNPSNMELIERLIEDEQEFFINNPEFTSDELLNFLRFHNPLAEIYLSDSDITMQMIYDIMQSSDY